MRWARYIPFCVYTLVLVALVPHLAFAQSTGVLSTIINPSGQCGCAGTAPDWGCVLQTFQIVVNDFAIAATIVITLFIGYAGFRMILNPTNSELRTQARNRVLNAVIGLLIVLCAFLIVNSVMAVLYNGAFGAWNAILAPSAGSSNCIVMVQPKALPGISGAANAQGQGTASAPGGGTAVNNPNATLNTGGVNACNASTIQSSAAAEGVTISNQTANTEACLAKYESSCGANNLNYKWGQGSSAAGAFQVTLQGNSKCYDNQACETAVGASGPLNCASGFSGGNPIAGSQTAATCQRAAANLGCSAAAAQCVLNTQGIGAYTADKNSTGQGSCGS